MKRLARMQRVKDIFTYCSGLARMAAHGMIGLVSGQKVLDTLRCCSGLVRMDVQKEAFDSGFAASLNEGALCVIGHSEEKIGKECRAMNEAYFCVEEEDS